METVKVMFFITNIEVQENKAWLLLMYSSLLLKLSYAQVVNRDEVVAERPAPASGPSGGAESLQQTIYKQ